MRHRERHRLPFRPHLFIMDYKSKRWKKLRESILRRDNYLCQESLRYGKRVQANTVHHIFPAEDYPELQWQPWNLISLSEDMHNRMHNRATGELSEEGENLRKRTARKHSPHIEHISE